MGAKAAKDFLVHETAKQAAFEGVPFSDLERRMMYFVENEEMPEDPIKLNEEFEANCDSEEYETKMSKLMHHAYARIRKENPEAAQRWNAAIRELSKGDHYLPVLWGEYDTYRDAGGVRPPYDSLKLLGTAILLAALLGGAIAIAAYYGIHLRHNGTVTLPAIQRSLPPWLQRTFVGLMLAAYAYFVIVPWIWKKSPTGLNQLLTKWVKQRKSHSR